MREYVKPLVTTQKPIPNDQIIGEIEKEQGIVRGDERLIEDDPKTEDEDEDEEFEDDEEEDLDS